MNDAFVMAAWGVAQGAEGKVRMLADPEGAFTRALGLEANAPAPERLRGRVIYSTHDGNDIRAQI